MVLARRILLCCFFIPFYCIGQGISTNVQSFLPEVFSQFSNVRDIAIAPQGNEIYFTIQSFGSEISAIAYITKKKNKWSKPKIISCSGQYHDLEPFMTSDGLRLFFASNRPLSKDSIQAKDYDIWYVDRTDIEGRWSEAKNLGAPINTSTNEFFPCLSSNRSIYYTSDGSKSIGKDDIFYCKYENGQYKNPISLTDSVNTEGHEFNAFIAPDESYIIYTCYNRPDGLGSGDLYISYRLDEATWTSGKNLGFSINSKQMDYCPFVSAQSGKLYFTSKRNQVEISFENAQNINQLLKEMYRYENGISHIYQVDLKDFIKHPRLK